MTHENAVRRLSRLLNGVTTALMVSITLGAVAWLWFVPPTPTDLQAAHPGVAVSPDMTTWQIIAVVVVGFVPLLLWLWTLDQMRRLFRCFQAGLVLTDEAAFLIGKIGRGFLMIGCAQLVSMPLKSVLVTWENPVGMRSLSISLSTDMLGVFVAGALLTVIGWAMRDAAAIRAENRAFI